MVSDINEQFGILRSIKEEELLLMLSWRNAPNVRANMYTRHEISVEEHLSWWNNVRHREDQVYLMYEFQGKTRGIVAFTGIDSTNQNTSWAFYTSLEAPRGCGAKMEYLALEYAFNILSTHKLWCEVLSFNISVIKLHHKFGFKTEGVLREHHLVDGEYVDIHRLGLLATEWDTCKQSMFNVLLKLNKGAY